MKKWNSILMLVSLIMLVVSFWNRNQFTEPMRLLEDIHQEPMQTPIQQAPFDVTVNERTYRIEPLFDYELFGMVVSYQHHDGDSMLHAAWNDHLNMLDLCVVWDQSATTPYLNNLDFWNGQFTCFVETRDQQAWDSFNMNQLSNNHLISADPFIRDQVSKVRIGDQVRIRGWLSRYQYPDGGVRGTSTTRTDSGNGACETIYVNDFQIVSSMKNGWRTLVWLSLALLITTLVIHFRAPFKVADN